MCYIVNILFLGGLFTVLCVKSTNILWAITRNWSEKVDVVSSQDIFHATT